MQTSAKGKGGAGAPKEPSKFQQFREGLTNLMKKFGEDGEGDDVQLAASSPTQAELEAKATSDAAQAKADADAKATAEAETIAANEKKSASERMATLEAENRALKANEANHAADAKKSDDRIAALEMSEHSSRFEKIVNGEGPGKRWVGSMANHVKHMLSLRKAFGENSEEFKHYVSTQKAQVVAMNTAGIFDERGSAFGVDADDGTETPDGALAELKKIASELRKEAPADAPLTEEQALVKAGELNPELKQKYREQFRSRNTVK